MGCSGSSAASGNGTLWAELKERLPIDKDSAEDKQKRTVLFGKFDEQKRNTLTEADCLTGCKKHLELDKLTENLPAINSRAYKAACSLRTKEDATDGVDPAEFRLYLQYIRDYFELNVMFNEVDTSADRNITLAEFQQALPRIEKWGIKIKNPEAEFKKIDKDGNGMNFDEFADWAIRSNLDAEKDASLAGIPQQKQQQAAPAPDNSAPVAVAAAPVPVAAAPVKEEPKPVAAPAPVAAAPAKEEPKPVAAPAPVAAAPAPAPPAGPSAAELAAAKRKAMWVDIKARLPRKKTPEQNAARDELFKKFDPNGNGYLAYGEIERGCKDILKLDEFTDNLDPILIRAYNAARNARKGKGAQAADQDAFVERVEFRLLLVYIYDYFELWIAFDEIDTSDDMKVSFEEFKAALPKFEKWGVPIADPKAEFAQVDKNGGGSVTFPEFAEWAIAKHLDADGEENQA